MKTNNEEKQGEFSRESIQAMRLKLFGRYVPLDSKDEIPTSSKQITRLREIEDSKWQRDQEDIIY